MCRVREAGDPMGAVSNGEFVAVTPERGAEKWVAQELLALADNPFHVKTRVWPQLSFIVPRELFDRFQARMGADDTIEPIEAAEISAGTSRLPDGPNVVTAAETSAAVRRKPGRPRKNDQQG